MKKLIGLLVTGVSVLTVGAMSVKAYSDSAYKTPAEAAAGVTGKTVEEVIAEKKETGNTYGEIAKSADKLDEFKAEILTIKKDILDQKVADGTLTQEKADEIYKALEENSANCDGTGEARIGQKYGVGFGKGNKSLGTGEGDGRKAGQENKGNRGNKMGKAEKGTGICSGQVL